MQTFVFGENTRKQSCKHITPEIGKTKEICDGKKKETKKSAKQKIGREPNLKVLVFSFQKTYRFVQNARYRAKRETNYKNVKLQIIVVYHPNNLLKKGVFFSPYLIDVISPSALRLPVDLSNEIIFMPEPVTKSLFPAVVSFKDSGEKELTHSTPVSVRYFPQSRTIFLVSFLFS